MDGDLPLIHGYPACADVVQWRRQENVALHVRAVREPFKSQFLKRVEDGEVLKTEDGYEFFSLHDRLLKKQTVHGDLTPNRHVEQRQEKSRYTGGGGGCFTWDTTVSVLMQESADGEGLISILDAKFYKDRIENLHSEFKGDPIFYGWILASTVAFFPKDPRYHLDCWARINNTFVTYLESDDTVQITTLQRGGELREIQSTPVHHFLTSDLKWIPARELRPGMQLYAPTNLNAFEVLKTRTHTIDQSFWAYVTDSARDPKSNVYNLSTDVATYYMGPPEQRVLVHNFVK